MEFISSLPPIAQAIAILILGVLAVAYIFSLVRKQDMKTLREANGDLRDTLDDQKTDLDNKGKEIDILKTHIISMERRIDDLEKRNKTLEEVVIVALKEYFKEHPETAVKLRSIDKSQ